MRTKVWLIFALCSITLLNCKKDDKNSRDILTSKTWNRGLTDRDPSTNPPGTVLYYAVKDCEKDDTFKFEPNGKVTLNRNGNKCDQDESPVAYQDYTLNRATKEFIIDGTKYILAEESANQIKYYTVLPGPTEHEYLVFLLQ